MDADDLMRHADIAMYRAKEAGKGQVRAFTPDMHPNALTKAPSRDEILAALDARRVRRPLPADRARSARARSSPPRRSCAGTIRATGCSRRRRSCPAAEATGTIPGDRPRRARAGVPRGRGLDGRGRLRAATPAVHVNLSGEGLRTSELVGVVEDVLARHRARAAAARARADRERADRRDADGAAGARPRCARSACGSRSTTSAPATRRSSCLRSLPVDILKVAKPFVDGAGRTPHDHALLAMIIELGSLFGVSVVAEGIERQDQLDALADLRCDMGQGFFLGRPLDGEARRFARRDPLAAAA